MQNQYQPFDGQPKKKSWMPWALGIITVLCLIATALAIYFAADSSSSNSNSSTGSSTSSSECTSTACIELADSILSSIDETVDPCDDFFKYACGNWMDDNDWELIETSSYSQFSYLGNYEMEEFLDALYYNTNNTLIDHSSVLKSKLFYDSCYNSDVTEESLEESELLIEFINAVNFTNDETAAEWDDSNKQRFISAISWLTARNWNFLFETSTLQTTQYNFPLIYQNYQTWLAYNSTLFKTVINSTYVPLYQSYFGLTESEALQMGKDVSDFADSIATISTASLIYYDQTLLYQLLLTGTSLGNLTQVFDASDILNITEILFETFNTKDISYVLYFTPGVSYFNNLTNLLSNTDPNIVQYYLYTSVLINGLNFEDSLQQSRLINRVEFCFSQMLEQFPFIYGYILDHVLFGKTKYNAVYDLVSNILQNGIRTVLQEATWLDDTSLANSIKKVDNLGIYVGLPPKIGNYTALDIYYASVTQSNSTFVDNLGELLNFQVYVTQATFAGTIFDLITPWPSTFSDSSGYDSWLTGINAFYSPNGNFFTIPVTISQMPYFDANYPSAINFGGLGSVIGHEISHGFDPTGSYYNYNGSYGDIWSNATRTQYNEVTQCFVEQYNGLEIEPGIYVNGTTTLGENVADNGGNSASYTAWQEYIKTNGNDATLPGVDLTSVQLFFWSWAHVWCEVSRPNYYSDWTNVHSPNPARVWGVVQNSEEFADAYNCESGSKMNPESKCVLW